ncbi:hypothetical protein HL658_35400 [Azospirillum sp. RWY-5-1]|uniref:Lipoprotein n=1 Tax=Azospirillum oleiclasticum TaxID=2735135 RepID=A0ABX2TLE7_9PROT|nr:hypothetical protein [Azospirillum oleiclasticum]NYZ17858.1 hypothetical protein [Azospirillum oleiclasticum]NYZ25066.1 hypothetical protein [Azospirillum oleiclasticum]
MPVRPVLLAAVAALVLTACQSAPPRPPVRPVNFANFAPIVLNVATVDVVDQRRAGGAASVDGRIPVPPAEAVRRWAAERLQAGGLQGRVRVVIKDATVVETQLPRTGGVQGFFTTQQAQRYDGRIEVEVTGEVPGDTAFRGFTRAAVTTSTTVPENITLADREATLQEMTRSMAEDLNARLDAGIRKDLAGIVMR